MTGIPCVLDALNRVRPTRQQTTLSITERLKNVEGAFRVTPDHAIHINGHRVVLVDDVVTTGATINACTRALLREQAVDVDILAFSKVVDETVFTI